MAYVCSKDPSHQSDDSDYCSICGAKIDGAASAISSASAASAVIQSTPAAAGQGEICPDCGTARHPGARFCEVCRYNYETRTSGGVSSIAAAPMVAPLAPIVVAPVGATIPDPAVAPAPFPAEIQPVSLPDAVLAASLPLDAAVASWEAVVRVDASLYIDQDPAIPCPVTDPERIFPLDLAENLIGRRSDRLDIHPEIPLTDPGVSHRHAKIYREADGSVSVLDVGSTNATTVNGAEAAAGVRVPLKEGDEITIGCWTRIVIRRAIS